MTVRSSCESVGEMTRKQSLPDVTVSAVYPKRIESLAEEEFEGESPDCKDPETTALVLSSIYRTVVSTTDEVWVVKFKRP